MGEFVRVETDADHPAVAVIRLDRPKMNALNTQVQRELAEAAAQVSEDSAVAAAVIYGGERVFAAGADIKEMADMDYAAMAAHSRTLQDCFTAVARIPKPVIAAITGYALGGGCELALCADFRVAADNAKLGQPEIQLGIIPGAGGTQRLPRLIGPAKAKDLIFTCRHVMQRRPGDRSRGQGGACRRGYATAVAMAARYANGLASHARRQTGIDAGLEVDLDTGLEIERLQFSALRKTRRPDVSSWSTVPEGHVLWEVGYHGN